MKRAGRLELNKQELVFAMEVADKWNKAPYTGYKEDVRGIVRKMNETNEVVNTLFNSRFFKGGQFDIASMKKLIVEQKTWAAFVAETYGPKAIQSGASLGNAIKMLALNDNIRLSQNCVNDALIELGMSKSEAKTLSKIGYSIDDVEKVSKVLGISDKELSLKAWNEAAVGNRNGMPTRLIANFATNMQHAIDKKSAKYLKSMDLHIVAEPKKADYIAEGIENPYLGQKRSDLALFYTDKKGKRNVLTYEHFGWTGSAEYRERATKKAKELAECFEKLFKSESTTIYDEEIFNKNCGNSSVIERNAEEWVLKNCSFYANASEVAVAMDDCFYAMFKEIGAEKSYVLGFEKFM